MSALFGKFTCVRKAGGQTSGGERNECIPSLTYNCIYADENQEQGGKITWISLRVTWGDRMSVYCYIGALALGCHQTESRVRIRVRVSQQGSKSPQEILSFGKTDKICEISQNLV